MRNRYFDVLKAIAIIAVVLYHLGICEYGYLGVDIFLVIAGFFTSQSVEKHVVNKGGYLWFVENRVFRLWPLLLLAGVMCLGWGWLMMLPDDFENTAQSIVVGLIMQFYIIVPMLLFAVGRWVKDVDKRKKVNITLMALMGMASLVGYLTEGNAAAKFYYLPYRLYEFCAGGLVFYLFGNVRRIQDKIVWTNIGFVIVYLAVVALLFVDAEYVSRPAKLLSTVALSSVLMVQMPRVEWAKGKVFSNKWVAAIGTASFSIFVWHQVVLALIRYSFTNKLTEVLPLLAFFGITAVLSVLSYRYVEQMKKTKLAWVLTGLMLVVTTGASLYIYKNAGVVRDVPELEVVKGNVHRGMWAEYCDRVKWYDRDYPETDKTKWYVIGNSFGRDLVNIILESPIADKVEIGYSESLDNREHRLREVDVLFISTKGVTEELIEKVKSMLEDHTKLYVVGEKNFGENNTGVSPQV